MDLVEAFADLRQVKAGATVTRYKRLSVKYIRAQWNKSMRAAQAAMAAVGTAA
jgi:hypothetical protein